MNLPSIKITLPLLFALWCAGAYLAGMTPLLVYPALWAGVGLLFAGLHVMLKGKRSHPPAN